MTKHEQPFKVGQLAETRSNTTGYRGAWFRCKIKKITPLPHKKTLIAVEYYDYPDEKTANVKLYQIDPSVSSRSKKVLRTMVRPCFPPVYRESELPEISTTSEVVVAVCDSWKIGDLIDWFKDGCFWTGRIIEILGDEKVKIQLPLPPEGEGGSPYEASTKDLRPSLDWSLEHGWTVATALGTRSSINCVRLIKPVDQGNSLQNVRQDEAQVRENMNSELSSEMEDYDAESDQLCASGSSKKFKSDIKSGTLEANIVDLEELSNKVYWLRSILESGLPVPRPSWRFVEVDTRKNQDNL